MQVRGYPDERPFSRDIMHSASNEEQDTRKGYPYISGGQLKLDGLVDANIRTPSLWYFFAKRLFDVSLSLMGLIMLSPVLLVIGICIRLNDGGPVLHFREIIGEHGRRFYALKFRTMIPDAETYLEQRPELMREYQKNVKLKNDPRVTRVGMFLRNTNLDEVPQLFNVIVGQMTLVGPRIIHPSELSRFGKYAQKRLSVRPGITGLWQISDRKHICYDERIMLDMRYIDTRSFKLDLIILLKTLKILFMHS